MELHENIKALRTSRGWSQQHLADLAGYGDRSSIAKIESGKVDLPRSKIAEFARIFDVTPAYLMGYSDDTLALLDAIVDDNKTGRPAAIDELRRLFGTEHSIHNIYACEDSKRIALLYYKALERNVALSLTDIIGTVDQFDGSQAEKTMLLLHAYLKAGQPIRNIVDTALDPYVEDLDELPCSNSQIDPLKSDTKPAPVKQTVLPFPKAKINHRKEDNFDELTVFEEAAAAGMQLRILDIGGGFPIPEPKVRFNLKEMLKQINARLDEDFPNVEIWAEPGRFMCGTAVNLITSVIGVTERGGQPWYFLDDGLYGTFSGVIFDQWDFKLISFKEGEEVEATFAGPSCDSLDIMFRGKLTVRQEVGDLLLVPSCGAYTSASATTFNGFSKANFIVWEDLKDEIEPQPQAAMVG